MVNRTDTYGIRPLRRSSTKMRWAREAAVRLFHRGSPDGARVRDVFHVPDAAPPSLDRPIRRLPLHTELHLTRRIFGQVKP